MPRVPEAVLCLSTGKVGVPEEELDAMLQEGKGPINFTVFLTLFGEKLNGKPGQAGCPGRTASLSSAQIPSELCLYPIWTPPGPYLGPIRTPPGLI